FPLQETTIQLKKEMLNLTRQEKWMQVDVYFEFYNPGPEKELIVGFVTPPEAGDVVDRHLKHPKINNFIVIVNNDSIDYKIVKMNSSGFRIADSLVGGDDFVYYFKVIFPPGETKIRHGYKYRGGEGVLALNDYYYRLTTGTGWANREIEDFELNIDMGEDCYFSLPHTFNNSKANWTIIGEGRLSNKMLLDNWDDYHITMAYVRTGTIQLKAKHFKPTNDLSIMIFQPDTEFQYWSNDTGSNEFWDMRDFLWKRNIPIDKRCQMLSDRQLRLWVNLPYARAGYLFKDTDLKEAFSGYVWYMPDSNVPAVFKPYYYDYETFNALVNELEQRKKEDDR
ncbi:MAG TPA: YARHG domain-containing protein, partial [Flavipsychrobacter sp.]